MTSSSDKNIKKFRDSIDAIDDKIVALLNYRAETALRISERKKKNSYNIYDPVRENEIIKKLKSINKGPLSNIQLISVFKQIISVCREIQKPLTLTVLGPKGSYTHQVAQKIMGNCVCVEPVATIDEVFSNVEKGLTLYGVVPIENSIEGSVGSVLDRLLETDVRICGEYYEKISHCMLSRTGRLNDIKTIASHPQALGQCRKWLSIELKGRSVDFNEVSSTARAAQIASENSNVAAIAGEINSTIYNLKIIDKHIEDSPNNTTRFIVLGFKENNITSKDKTSIVFSLKDQPGALSNALSPFENAGINLTKIESRPSRMKSWDYVFYIDFIGHYASKSMRNVLETVEKNCIFLKVLGSYPNGMSNI
jgi:chorismate mutase / prephenate dehydratase